MVAPIIPVLYTWNRLHGFKAEVDATLSESVPAWSITCDGFDQSVFEEAQSSTGKLVEFFDDEQQLMVRGALPNLPWEEIRAYGPLTSFKWQIDDSVSIERWTFNDESFIEISKRGEDQSDAHKEIRSWLKAADVRGGELSGGKTAWALKALVSTNS